MLTVDLTAKNISQLIADLAEPMLREKGLLMRPIPFFERLDRFRVEEEEIARIYQRYLGKFSTPTAERITRSFAFAQEFRQDLLLNFFPSLPENGNKALILLWGTAVAIDQLLDEEGLDPVSFIPLQNWVRKQYPQELRPQIRSAGIQDSGLKVLAFLLEETLAECRRRASDQTTFSRFHLNLVRMLDAELASLGISLNQPPEEEVRRIVYDKSVLLSWIGFQAASLSIRLEPRVMADIQEICDAAGEILWIIDDLVDLEEDFERGIWNRTLWRLYDVLGEQQFVEIAHSKERLVEEILSQGMVAREIDEIELRVSFLETHPRMESPGKIRTMISFWLTSWLGIYY